MPSAFATVRRSLADSCANSGTAARCDATSSIFGMDPPGLGGDGKRDETAQHEPTVVLQVVGREREVREPPEQGGDRAPALEAGERGTEAVVHPAAERDVRGRAPTPEVELVRGRAPLRGVVV